MKNFEKFLYEGVFNKTTFEEKIQQVEKLEIYGQKYIGILQTLQYGKAIGIYDRFLSKFINILVKISDKLVDIIVKDGKTLSQEQINIIVERFSYLNRNIRVPIKYSNEIERITKNLNVILNILYWFKNTKHFIVDIDDRRFDNPIVIKKRARMVTFLHKSAFDRNEDERIKRYADIDPLGEEDWGEN